MEHPTRPGGGDLLGSTAESLRRARELVADTFTAALEETTTTARVMEEKLAGLDPSLREGASQGISAVREALSGAWARIEQPLGRVIDALAGGSTVAVRGSAGGATQVSSVAEWPSSLSHRLADETDPVVLDLRERLFVQDDREARAAWGRELMEQTERGSPQDRLLERVLGLPAYQYHELHPKDRPRVQFDELAPTLAAQPGRNTPEPSRLAYLTPVAKALSLTAADVVYDIGSGIGKAGLFFGAFTPAGRVVGFEIEPVYARFAEARARELNLSHVRFENADALEVDLSPGTAFYFYNPFVSSEQRDTVGMLADRLAELGARKRIQIAVKGPGLHKRLTQCGVFTAETVLEEPARWIVFRSRHADVTS